MENLYKLKKGLDLKLEGVAPKALREISSVTEYAVAPQDFYGMTPRLVVKEGDHIVAGEPLFTDKQTGKIQIVSPVSGIVKEIERGDRRKIRLIRLTPDVHQDAKEWPILGIEKITREDILERLLQSGLFAFFKQRPYDVIASPTDLPKGIFVSTFNKMPLAADFSYVVSGQEEEFKLGISVLSKLAKVYVSISPEQVNTSFIPLHSAEVNIFQGPNPAGNVGVQINHISPINKGEVAWTIGAEEVIFIGRLFKTGRIDLTRNIAIAGSEVCTPTYIKTKIGAAIKDIIGNNLKSQEHTRIINGNPLVGTCTNLGGFLGAHTTEICAIPDGDAVHEVFGWIAPRLNDFSTSRSYCSWLFRKKSYAPDCRIKGGQRHMIMSAEYERVFPMDIYPSYLIKAIITGNIDRQEELGIYEVAPEDFAVAEFIDSSKLELQRIVREGLDLLRKENA